MNAKNISDIQKDQRNMTNQIEFLQRNIDHLQKRILAANHNLLQNDQRCFDIAPSKSNLIRKTCPGISHTKSEIYNNENDNDLNDSLVGDSLKIPHLFVSKNDNMLKKSKKGGIDFTGLTLKKFSNQFDVKSEDPNEFQLTFDQLKNNKKLKNFGDNVSEAKSHEIYSERNKK